MQSIKFNDYIGSEDGKFLFQVIDEGAMGRGIKYIAHQVSDVRFSPTVIKKDTNIAEFIGEHLIWHPNEDEDSAHNTAFQKKRAEHKDYLVALDKSEEHLLIPTDDECVAFLINTKPKANNCKISIAANRAYVKTTRNIKPGDTLYISYGVGFTNRLKKSEEKKAIVVSSDSESDSDSDSSATTFTCPTCGKEFDNNSAYLKHRRQHKTKK